MTNEPFEILDQALRDVEWESQQLAEKVAELQFRTSPVGNRRTLTPKGCCAERRRGERRLQHRATAGRRTQTDRRLPPQERIVQWQSEMTEVLERSLELSQLKRSLFHTN